MTTATNETIRVVRIAAGRVVLQGDLIVPTRARGVVLFAHGSGSSRHSRRNRAVAEILRAGEMATLLMDLLTADEEAMDVGTGRLRFDIPLLTAPTRDSFALAGVIVVDTPLEVAVDRLVHQRGLSEQDARARIAAQMSRDERRRLADVVIDNRGSRADLEAAVDRAWAWIISLRATTVGEVTPRR